MPNTHYSAAGSCSLSVPKSSLEECARFLHLMLPKFTGWFVGISYKCRLWPLITRHSTIERGGATLTHNVYCSQEFQKRVTGTGKSVVAKPNRTSDDQRSS